MNKAGDHQARRFRAEWLGLGAILLMLAAGFATALLREHDDIIAREGEHLQSQAGIVDENLVRQLEGVSSALAGIRDGILLTDAAAAGQAAGDRLRLLASAMADVRTLAVIDRRGRVVASSRDELVGRDTRGQDYFELARRRPDRDSLYVSAPFQSSFGGRVIVIGKALTGVHGEFAGVVVASLDPDYFNVVMRSVLYAPDMQATLIHGVGKVFLTVPPDERVQGADLAGPDTLFGQHMRRGQNTSLIVGPAISGEERMVVMRGMNKPELHMDKPLVVAVSRDFAMIVSPWYARVRRFAAFFLAVALASCLAVRLSQRRRRAMELLALDAAAQRHQAAERLELALRGADLGLWELHLPSNRLVVNSRERALLGLAADGTPATDLSWDGLIHPDDRETVRAAFEPHLRGETDACECEHRVRRPDGSSIWVYSRAMVAERDANSAPMRVVGTHLDITARRLADVELARVTEMRRKTEERLSLALEGSGLALFDWNLVDGSIYHSAQAAALRGDPAVEATCTPAELRRHVHREDLPLLLSRIRDAVTGESPGYHAEFRLQKRSGAWLWLRARGRVVERDRSGRAVRLAGTYADINDRKLAEVKLRRLAEYDTLTELPNRALFRDRLKQALARATQASPMALLFVDIDHFKSVNDTLGHEAGDQLLRVFAQRMRATVRRHDMVARLAGDEFTVILEDLRDAADATHVADKLVCALREPIALAGKLLQITASMGVALSLPDEGDDAALLRRADEALYEAKRRGRDGFFCERVSEPYRIPGLEPEASSGLIH